MIPSKIKVDKMIDIKELDLALGMIFTEYSKEDLQKVIDTESQIEENHQSINEIIAMCEDDNYQINNIQDLISRLEYL